MILNSLDSIASVYDPEVGVRLTLANVTDTARALERGHLCGPIAGIVQAELVGAMTLLGTLLDAPGQRISLRVNLPEGQLGGAMLECAYGYEIRGYTRQKVLPQLDDSPESSEVIFDRALGHKAICAILRSAPGQQDSVAQFDLNYPDHLTITDLVEEYFNTSLQRRTLCQVEASSDQGYVAGAHAVMCDFAPEATDEAYDRLAKCFDFRLMQDWLYTGITLPELVKRLELNPVGEPETHTVCFRCRCSADRVLAMLRTLPAQERAAMVAAGKPTDIYCHMCGKCYSITPEQVAALG